MGGKRRSFLQWLRGERVDPRDVQPLPTDAPQEIERRAVDRLEDRGEIARGRFGSVRRVFDKNLRREVVLKLLDKLDDAPAFAEEAQITGQLEHPAVVPVYDFSADHEGTRYVKMKLVRGDALSKIIREERYDVRRWDGLYALLQIYQRVVEAVAYAHSRGVLHRDLRPDNVIVGDYGQVYVIGWALAKLCETSSAQNPATLVGGQRGEPSGLVVGTPASMSPEQARGEPANHDERTDVFGLGAVLYELLSGVPPFFQPTPQATLQMAKRGVVRRIEEMAPDKPLPRELCRICMRCLAPEPKARYASVVELKHDIDRFLRGGGSFPSRSLRQGEHLIVEGEPGTEAYIVNKGRLEVYRMVNGQRVTLATLGPGAVVGEQAVLNDKPRLAHVLCLTDVVVTTLTREALERELGINSWMGVLVRSLAERFGDIDVTLGATKASLDQTTTALEHARIAAWVLQYIVLYGAGSQVQWRPLLDALVLQWNHSHTEMTTIVAGLDMFEIDVANDIVRLKQR